MKPKIIAFRGSWVCYGDKSIALRGYTPHAVRVPLRDKSGMPFYSVVGLKGRTPYEALCRWKKASEK